MKVQRFGWARGLRQHPVAAASGVAAMLVGSMGVGYAVATAANDRIYTFDAGAFSPGGVSGASGASVELQYVGNGVFFVLSQQGTVSVH